MWKDPIVEEIHAIRRQIAKECGHDLHRVFALLKEGEAEHPERVVTKEQVIRKRRPKAKALSQ